jgi:hypothetical protein
MNTTYIRRHASRNFLLSVLLLGLSSALQAQSLQLSRQQQAEDFAIFLGGLKEGHGGLYEFIDSASFHKKADSVARTFKDGLSTGAYYLKLRYLSALLGQGHTRVNLPFESGTNYKMAVLLKDRQYLPLQLRIADKRLYVTADCSAERSVPAGAEIVSINGKPASQLLSTMLPYMFADGRNQTFKYYFLYNYYHFHFLYNLLYPADSVFRLKLANGKKASIKAQTPAAIEKTFAERNGKSISSFDNPLQYNATLAPNAAYLKIGSFYKGFIESFGTRYEPFLDSVFKDLDQRGTANLVLDLRNNEGGGDHYNDILFAYISSRPFVGSGFTTVPGRSFPFARYAVNLSDDLKAYIADPKPFLRDDTSLILKPEYTDSKGPTNPAAVTFKGPVYVLINGGTFSAGNTMVQALYQHRSETGRPVFFVGEQNGGDFFNKVQCAGQSYIIKLPASGIMVDMPFLCAEQGKQAYGGKPLPDYKVYETARDMATGTDRVLQFTLNLIHAGRKKSGSK